MSPRIPLFLAALATSACLTDEPDLGASDEELVLLETNCAMKSNEKGGHDTTIPFASFWTSPQGFTMSAWIMPEFVNAQTQPLFGAANSSFWIGPGNFHSRWRNNIKAPACDKKQVLTVKAGSRTVDYLAPSFTRHAWHHLALTWLPDALGRGHVHLYLDGVELMPHQNVGPSPAELRTCANTSDGVALPAVITAAELSSVPAGTLRVGGAQRFFYGLIDEVLVQNDALTQAQVQALMNGAAPAAGTTVFSTSFAGRNCATFAEITTTMPSIASHPCWKFVARGMPRDNTYLRRP